MDETPAGRSRNSIFAGGAKPDGREVLISN
jgi:hypothetical protein